MGFTYRKSKNIGGGTRLNVGKKSVGLSAGTKGARISVNSRGPGRCEPGNTWHKLPVPESYYNEEKGNRLSGRYYKSYLVALCGQRLALLHDPFVLLETI